VTRELGSPGQAADDGRVRRSGSGRRGSPFCYCLPGMEEKWRQDPLHLENLASLEELDALGEPAPLDELGMLRKVEEMLGASGKRRKP
jgi:hypothetical protein